MEESKVDAQENQATSIKALAESTGSVPSEYSYTTNANDRAEDNDPDHSIPTIDYSILTSGSPDQRSKVLDDLRKACEDWGFFMVINHGVPESAMKAMLSVCEGFFNLTEEEKKEFQGTTDVLDPIKCGTSFNVALDKVLLWRDFVKVKSHPDFYAPHKPAGFGEAASEFGKRTRAVAAELVKAISETLGLESDYIAKAMNWDKGGQLLAANFYPACPEPDKAIGIPPNTDHGLVTLLIQNAMGGLQVLHKGKWVNWNGVPNAFVVNLGDQMQILTNDKYKSVWHRAVVNSTATRISIAMPHRPAEDTVVLPAPELCEREGQKPLFFGMTYRGYIELQQSAKGYMKPCIDLIRV